MLPVTIRVVLVTALGSPRKFATNEGKVIDKRCKSPKGGRQHDTSQKVVGSNPRAGKR